MDDSKKSRQKPFSFKNLPHLMMNSFHRLRTSLQRFIEAIIAVILSVTNFFVGIFKAVSSAYERVAILILSMVDWVQQMFYYDFKESILWLMRLPKQYYTKCKEETRKHVWLPISKAFSRKVNRVSRAFKARLRDSVVYVRGFCEICRRLFLLTSDYTPGGKYTVTAILVIIAIIFFLKILTVVQVLIQIVELAYSIVAFLLHPLLLTLRDILLLFDPLFQIFISLVRVTIHAVLSIFKAIGIFIWMNLISIASGLYSCWQGFVNSAVVKLIWSLSGKVLYVLLEYFIFIILPVLTKATYYFAELSFDISSVGYTWFYPWFFRGFLDEPINNERTECFTPTGIGNGLFIFWAFLIAYRYRNRLSGTFFSEIDGKRYVIRSPSASIDRSKRDNQRERTSAYRNTTKYDSSRRRTTHDESNLRNRWKAAKDDSTENGSGNANDNKKNLITQFGPDHTVCLGQVVGVIRCQKSKYPLSK